MFYLPSGKRGYTKEMVSHCFVREKRLIQIMGCVVGH